MEWMQALWAFVALCAIAALWDAFVRRHGNARVEALAADSAELRARFASHAEVTHQRDAFLGQRLGAIEAADKQRESDMIALSNKVNSAHSAAATRWRRP